MSMKRISDEQLNAFVDNQLGPEEQEQIFRALKEDEQLNRQVCEARKLQDLMRHAYREVPAAPTRTTPRPRSRLTDAVAATVLLVVGALSGWFAHVQKPVEPTKVVYQRQDLDAFQTVQLMSAEGRQQNVILHLTTGDKRKLQYALSEVETLLSSYRERGLPIKLEVVANGEGLDLLRSKTSPLPERTQELIHNYDNLTIMACANALAQLKQQGVNTELLPNINTTKSALERVVDRLQDGWLYIKV